MVSCDKYDHGCHGGQLDQEWKFLEEQGTVSEACWAYESGDGSEPLCLKQCTNGKKMNFYKSQQDSLRIFTTPDQIKAEIMANGPVETGFMVYKDFKEYKGGVYK
jgi:cathepsin B